MELRWNDLTLEEWGALFARVPRSNLLQSWPYAQMMRAERQMSTRFGRLVEDGETVAMFQVHEVCLTPLYHAVVLDRGPLWLKPTVSDEDWQRFFALFTAEFPKRFGRRRRIMPEMATLPPGLAARAGLKLRSEGYRSIWLDLSQDEEMLRKNLKQKWRNALNQALKKNLTIARQDDPLTFGWLMEQYAEDRQDKAYQGPAVTTLKSLYQYCRPRGDVLLVTAAEKDEAVAGILVFRHGNCATYQVGWTSPAGRDARAHQLLLWEACRILKGEGVTWVDLGGIHPEQAAGVTRFKRGLGGDEFQLAGIYP